jgi:hypothetical protein
VPELQLNAALGEAVQWLPDNGTLLCQAVVADRGPPPPAPAAPAGPTVQESSGRQRRATCSEKKRPWSNAHPTAAERLRSTALRAREQKESASVNPSDPGRVQIPLCEDFWNRRVRVEADDTQWLRHYFHELFSYPFTTQQLEMIDAIRNAILYGGDQAIAASRGEGKTKIYERTLLKYTLAG